jgi:hypothetical protein
MLDGKANKYMRGGNVQRESFAKKAGGEKAEPEPKTKGTAKEGGEATTEITHHADGSHTAHHSDGEVSEHPHMGHLAMHLHAKHGDGEAMHVHKHEAGVRTHHVGMDGVVEGPHEHGSVDEAGEHMKAMLGDDGGNGAMNMSDGIEPHGEMSTLY